MPYCKYFKNFQNYKKKNCLYRLVSAGGILLIILFGFAFSANRKKIVWRHVIWGIFLQIIFGILIMRWDSGRDFINCIGSKVDTFLGFTDSGSSFVFGYLVDQKPFLPTKLENGSLAKLVAEEINNSTAVKSIVVFKALSTVYFFR